MVVIMKKDLFSKAVTDFLEDRIDNIDFREASLDYKKTDEKADNLYEQIKLLLDDKGQKLLLNLDTENNALITKAAEIGYQKGFTEGIKFIIYNLIMN